MEVIAKINDLACRSIEMGDYQTSLDVLNCCLGCVRQLKNQRTKMGEDENDRLDGRQKRTKDTISRMLEGAERKIMKRLTVGATSTKSIKKISDKKRKASTSLPSKATGTIRSTVSTTSRGKDVFSRSRKKRRRRMHNMDSSITSSSVNTSIAPTMTCASKESVCRSSNTLTDCSDSVATTSQVNPTVRNVRKQDQYQHYSQSYNQKGCNNEGEENFYVHCKPFRLTKFQWSRIDKYQCSSTSETTRMEVERERNDQLCIDREVELAVSSNLIFNIALTHHLIARSQEKKEQASLRFLCDNDDPKDELETDDENGCEYASTYSTNRSGSYGENNSNSFGSSEDEDAASNFLQTEERLRGALRLYELGFRIHTKRVAYVTALQTTSSMPEATPSSLSSVISSHPSSSSIPSNVSTTPTAMTALPADRPLPPRLRMMEDRSISSSSFSSSSSSSTQVSSSSSQLILRSDRETELKSTTRFALALLNNCAHIHEKLGQIEKAKIFQKRLLSFLLVIVDSGESIHEIIGEEPVVDGYLKNVFAGTVFDKDTAPAAVA